MYEIGILSQNHLINERYTGGKIGAYGIQIRDEVGVYVLFFWKLVTEFKCLGCFYIENTKKTASTQLLMYLRLNVADFSTNLFLTLLCDIGGNMVHIMM